MCGEQYKAVVSNEMVLGSPPRVRGTVIWTAICTRLDRITPACAGNRAVGFFERTRVKDHPRVCGEQFVLLIILLSL